MCRLYSSSQLMKVYFPDLICAGEKCTKNTAPCPASPVHRLRRCPAFGRTGCIINNTLQIKSVLIERWTAFIFPNLPWSQQASCLSVCCHEFQKGPAPALWALGSLIKINLSNTICKNYRRQCCSNKTNLHKQHIPNLCIREDPIKNLLER